MNLYISTDLGIKSSGGTVVEHELKALKTIDEVIEIGFNETHPLYYNLPDIPFLIDYFTYKKLLSMDLSNVKLAHFYGGCYTETIKYLRSKGIKTTYTIMWHNRKISIEEQEKYYGTYPFNYVKDDRLFYMFSDGVREADCVISAGKVPKELVLKEKAKKVEVIPLGCYIPEKTTPIPEKFDVGYLGAIGADKGLVYLIKAWGKLNYNDSTLIFAGNQTGMLSNIIPSFSSCGNYHIMGFIKEPSELYNKCSVYVQPSATEGFGLEVPEAMSYGRPVIVSDGVGASDCVTDGIDGFIVPKMNAEAIADKIDWFKNHPKELREMGKNAREKSEEYSWDKSEQKYINLWRSL